MGKSGPLSDIPGNFFIERLGTSAAIGSAGANAVLGDMFWVAPGDCAIESVWKVATGASEVTAATSITSASYRRFNLLNGGTAGTGTTIIASLNNTFSGATYGSKGFATTANSTVPAGAVVYMSQLTVGAATADGTDAAASVFQLRYRLL